MKRPEVQMAGRKATVDRMILGQKSRSLDPTEILPVKFCEKELTPCPACGRTGTFSKEARWNFVDTYYFFTCDECGTVYKVGKSDLNGFSYSTDSLAGMIKYVKKRKPTEIYVTVETVGAGADNKDLQAGKVYTAEELKQRH